MAFNMTLFWNLEALQWRDLGGQEASYIMIITILVVSDGKYAMYYNCVYGVRGDVGTVSLGCDSAVGFWKNPGALT